jgi:hypothetical protein
MAMASPFGLAPRAVTWESRTLTFLFNPIPVGLRDTERLKRPSVKLRKQETKSVIAKPLSLSLRSRYQRERLTFT